LNEKNIKWDKVFYGKAWVHHVVETIRAKDILQRTGNRTANKRLTESQTMFQR